MPRSLLEARLKPYAAEYLAESGYVLIFPPPTASRVVGKGEFPIEVLDADGVRARRPLDVLGARWRNEREVEIAAIELKDTRWAVYDALGQAVQYQSVCDEVSIGTPQNVDGDPLVRATLADLGLGYVQVDENEERAFLTVPPEARRGSRFQPEEKARRASCRLAPGLAFLEASKAARVRYGLSGTRKLSAWYAEEVHRNLQWNCWHNCSDDPALDKTGAGINVEIKADIDTIVAHVDRAGLAAALAALPPDYLLDVQYCPNPSNPNIPNDPTLSAIASTPGLSPRAIDALTGSPKGRRPQLAIQHEVTRSVWARFTRADYVAWLGKVRADLSVVMDLLRRSYPV